MIEQEEFVRIYNVRYDNGIVTLDISVKTSDCTQVFTDNRLFPGDEISIVQGANGLQPEGN